MNTIHSTFRHQQGVTLVELMVALLLSLLLVAGMIQVFAGNRATYEFTQSLSRIQENARFALDHMAFGTRMAGYQGCMSDVAVYNNLAAPDTFRDDIEDGIRGFDADGTSDGEAYDQEFPPAATWTPGLPAALTGATVPPLQGSDVLVVRGMGVGAMSLVSPFTNAAQLFVSTPHDFQQGEILVVSDCQKASIFQVTNIDNTGVNIVHSNSGSYVPGNAFPNWPPEQDYGLGAKLARLQTFAFYVGQGANGPALFQLRLQGLNATQAGFGNPEELVEGIDSMHIRYGVDTDNDGSVNDWRSAESIANWLDVLSVEISLLVRATEEYGTEVDTAVYDVGGVRFDPIDDRRLRQVFSTTVGVRNRLKPR